LNHFFFFFLDGRYETLVHVSFCVVLVVLELELVLPIPIRQYYALFSTHAYLHEMGVCVGAWERLASKAIVTSAIPPHIYVCVVREYR
jgi:hypothetical protein